MNDRKQKNRFSLAQFIKPHTFGAHFRRNSCGVSNTVKIRFLPVMPPARHCRRRHIVRVHGGGDGNHTDTTILV